MKYCVFILTNGRPNNVITIKTLKSSGFSGRVFLIVDDLDKTKNEYIKNFGKENVYVFNKREIAKSFDAGDNFGDMRTITHARNASFEAAEHFGYEYFIQLDDDYTSFQYRFDQSANYKPKALKNLDKVLDAMVRFYIDSGADTFAMAQGGDFIGGEDSGNVKCGLTLKRKCMNSFICSTKRKFKFLGTFNEDVNTYTRLGSTGKLFLTTNQINLNQLRTQSNDGGITELYRDYGTYVKSLYPVMFHPSSVKVGMMITKHQRIHHMINWKKTVPKILKESLRK